MSKENLRLKRGITLIALIITIVVMLILVGVSVNVAFNENGLIANARKAAFMEEMMQIKGKIQEQEVLERSNKKIKNTIEKTWKKVKLEEALEWDDDLKKEVIYWGKYKVGISEITKEYAKENGDSILEQVNKEGIIPNLYYVKGSFANGEQEAYIYDTKEHVLYKVAKTRIVFRVVHSIEELQNEPREETIENLIEEESKIVKTGNISHYEPDLSGFNTLNTTLVYYNGEETEEISAEEYYKKGKPREIQKNGTTYEFYNYEKQKWANIKVENPDTGTESWWVWIPRYAYKIDTEAKQSSIIFIDTNNAQASGGELEEGYIPHPTFGNDLKGIWVSKYEPTQVSNISTGDFPYYIPDLEGFNADNTYIESYDKENNKFIEQPLREILAKSSTIDEKGIIKEAEIISNKIEATWYNYEEKIYANIKVVNPETKAESWWVWIPRYAYRIEGSTSSIVFIDTNNKPFTGGELGTGYIPHPTFGSNLKGIWVSKYEPVLLPDVSTGNSTYYEPDLEGFDINNTYIELYDGVQFTDQPLKDVLSNESTIENNIVKNPIIDKNKLKGTWYDYNKRIYANIKIKNPATNAETWWVWIPRYAYEIVGTTSKIIFIDVNNKPFTGGDLPSSYIPHPTFGNDLKGIWVSKYEPSRRSKN